jgi:hypothetical protein
MRTWGQTLEFFYQIILKIFSPPVPHSLSISVHKYLLKYFVDRVFIMRTWGQTLEFFFIKLF